jgi:hypothetical protein
MSPKILLSWSRNSTRYAKPEASLRSRQFVIAPFLTQLKLFTLSPDLKNLSEMQIKACILLCIFYVCVLKN